jgi:3-dehydroquinate synthase
MNSTTIRSNKYEVFLGNDTFYQIGKFIARSDRYRDAKKYVLVDSNTKIHCLPLLQKNVLAFQEATVLEIIAGEKSKSIETIVRLWSELTETGADRNSLLLNLGGGVVSDIGGFTASTYMRGIDFMNMPTTLLAMVDASVGGKNGINFKDYKNQIGTFDEPKAVFASPVFLKTLPPDEIRSGFAEVIKHALISDPKKWEEVKSIEQLDNVNWFDIIKESIRTKNKIVNSDYRDKHLRKALNFGHTIGHALESFSQKNHSSPLKHGEAISIGMLGEIFLSQRICGLNENVANDICNFICRHYNTVVEFDNASLISLMKGDKKNSSDKISFSLIRSIGDPVINQTCDDAMISNALVYCKEQLFYHKAVPTDKSLSD